ncbi:MAG: histidinol-phosphate transaminase [Neisseriaceae bacterium]|nr:histidinol-phosphate transaminase [Neisseriaceae bacterium]
MKSLSDLIRADILASSAYHVANVPDNCVKLDAMESPYDFPPDMQNALGERLKTAPIRLYPNIAADDFIPKLKAAFHIPQTASVALGNGSDELIQFITMLLAKPNAKVLAIEPTFVMYRRNAELFGMQYIGVDCNDDLTLNLDVVLRAIDEEKPDLIFIAYPNNPTGTRYPREMVEQIIQAATGIVVIDEAYGAFSSDSFLSSAGKIDNLLVLRTFSKIGFAGLRIGYVSGSLKIINELNKILPPYNMNQLGLTAAKFALENLNWINNNINILKMEREIAFAKLEDIKGVTVYPSEGNFLTVKVPNAEECFDLLLQNGFLIKNLSKMHPLLKNCVRITIGKPEDNAKWLSVLQKAYG